MAFIQVSNSFDEKIIDVIYTRTLRHEVGNANFKDALVKRVLKAVEKWQLYIYFILDKEVQDE